MLRQSNNFVRPKYINSCDFVILLHIGNIHCEIYIFVYSFTLHVEFVKQQYLILSKLLSIYHVISSLNSHVENCREGST